MNTLICFPTYIIHWDIGVPVFEDGCDREACLTGTDAVISLVIAASGVSSIIFCSLRRIAGKKVASCQFSVTCFILCTETNRHINREAEIQVERQTDI